MLTGYKTFLTALGVAVFGALETFDFTNYLNEQNAGIAALAVSVLMMVLRAVTKTPVLKSE